MDWYGCNVLGMIARSTGNIGSSALVIFLCFYCCIVSWTKPLQFGEPDILTTAAETPSHLLIDDVNQDTYPDLMVSSTTHWNLFWIEPPKQDALGWTPHYIQDNHLQIRDIAMELINDDGIKDIVYITPLGGADPSGIYWMPYREGPGGVIDLDIQDTYGLQCGDLNGDNYADVLVLRSTDDSLHWYENPKKTGSYETRGNNGLDVLWRDHELAVGLESPLPPAITDLDGDGDMDIVCASKKTGVVTWFENIRNETRWRRTEVARINHEISFLRAADVNGDDDDDLIITSGSNPGIWLENPRQKGGEWQPHPLPNETQGVDFFSMYDLDEDGDKDILAAIPETGTVGWFENSDHNGLKWATHLTTSRIPKVSNVCAGDLDKDGDNDIVAISPEQPAIYFLENRTIEKKSSFPSPAIQFQAPLTISDQADGAHFTHEKDIDGDGDIDIAAALFDADEVGWYENLDGAGTEWEYHLVEKDLDGAHCVFADDLDEDGDIDIVAAIEYAGFVTWHENENEGKTWTTHFLSTESKTALWVYVEDIDGDGGKDIISASQGNKTVAWYQNPRQKGLEWTAHTIDSKARGPNSIYAVDMDGDKDIDVVCANYDTAQSDLVWYENKISKGLEWEKHVIIDTTFTTAYRGVFCADLDGDGDWDVLTASSAEDRIAWYENRSGDGKGEWTERTISSRADCARCVYAFDLDGDRDTDVLSASSYDGKISWYENLTGDGQSWQECVLTTGFVRAVSVSAKDIDKDGDVDVIAAGDDADAFIWFRNEPAYPGIFQFLMPDGLWASPLANLMILVFAALSLLLALVWKKLRRLSRTVEDTVKTRTQTLQTANHSLRALIQASPLGILVFDRELNVRVFNPAATNIFGWNEEEVTNGAFCDLVEQKNELQKIKDSVHHRRTATLRDLHLRRKNGSMLDINLSLAPLEPFADDDLQAVAVVDDVTEQKILEKEVLDISNREQKRIGQEIHDSLCQQLTGIAILSRALEKELSHQSAPNSDTAHKITSLTLNAVQQARNLAKGLYPLELEEGGLTFALKELARQTGEMYPCHCSLHGDETIAVDDITTANHLYRITQEAINNAVKHGGADRIDVHLRQNGHGLELCIHDNGTGFQQPVKSLQTNGMGLRIMRHRADMIDAGLEFLSNPDGGCIVSCVVNALATNAKSCS